MPRCFTEVKAVIKSRDRIQWRGKFRAIKKKGNKVIYTSDSLRKFMRWKDGHRSRPAMGTRTVRGPTGGVAGL